MQEFPEDKFIKVEPSTNNAISYHSSELCLMKCSSKMLQNLSYFWNTKTHVVLFSLMNAMVYVDIDRGIRYLLGGNEKGEKNTWVFVFQMYDKF